MSMTLTEFKKVAVPDRGIYPASKARQPSFQCPACGSHYPTVEKMLACFNQKLETGRFKVGDLVIVGNYLVPDADPRDDDPWWAGKVSARPQAESHFDRIDHFYAWYVVTSLRQERHNEVASLVTLFDTGDWGWNPTVANSHYCLWREGVTPGTVLPQNKDHWNEEYFAEEYAPLKVRPPSARLREEAAKLAAEGYVTYTLL